VSDPKTPAGDAEPPDAGPSPANDAEPLDAGPPPAGDAVPPEAGTAPERAAFRVVYPFELPVLVFGAIAIVVSETYGFRLDWNMVLDSSSDVLIMREAARYSAVVLVLLYAKRRFQGEGRAEILGELRRVVAQALAPWKDWRRWVELVRVLFALKICLMLYSHLKQAIPIIRGVDTLYDGALWNIDRALHFGGSPAHACAEVFQAPWLSRPIDALYVLWYTVKVPFLVYFVFLADRVRSWRFLSAYFCLWIVGVFLAILWPSVGPIYDTPALFEGIDAPFAQQLQTGLWERYQAFIADPGHFGLYDGVAAFPSLHVGFAALFTASVRRIRVLFWPMVVFTALILLGSVALGWHYAVDGYASIVIAVVLWALMEKVFPAPPNSSTPGSEESVGPPTPGLPSGRPDSAKVQPH
jgi:hypothetical protein